MPYKVDLQAFHFSGCSLIGLGLPTFSSAGTVETVILIAPAHDITHSGGPNYYLTVHCGANAATDAETPSDSRSDTNNYTLTLRFHYHADNVADAPPASVTASYGSTFNGGWTYQLLSSGSVSADYSVTATLFGASQTLAGSSGTVTQAGRNSSPSGTVVSKRPSGTVAIPDGAWVHQDGSLDYSYSLVVWQVSGNAHASASGGRAAANGNWRQSIDDFTVHL